MPSAARGVVDRSVGHSAFRILPTIPQPTSADFITFRISANYHRPFFAPLPVRPWLVRLLADSLLWLFHPQARSPPGSFSPGWFAPWLFRPLACSPPVPDWLAPWLVCPLAHSSPGLFAPGWFAPPPIEYTCESLLRIMFVFQFTERQQVSNGQTTVDNHSYSSSVTRVRSAKNTHYLTTVTIW